MMHADTEIASKTHSQLTLDENICRIAHLNIPIPAIWATQGFEHLFLGFSYHLSKESNEKTGSIYLISIGKTQKLSLLDKISHKFGILSDYISEIEGADEEVRVNVSLGCSDGRIRVIKIKYRAESGNITSEEKITRIVCVNSELICLFHEEIGLGEGIGEHHIAGLTEGKIGICGIGEGGMDTVNIFKGHEYEVWAVHSDPATPNIIYSGSDDCLLKQWDLREGVFTPSGVNKEHSAGITTIRALTYLGMMPYSLSTSSYDGKLRIFDIRKLNASILHYSLGDQLWDYQLSNTLHPDHRVYFAGASMYDGFIVGQMDNGLGLLKWSFQYKAHNSIAYALYFWEEEGVINYITASFYDNLINYWSIYI